MSMMALVGPDGSIVRTSNKVDPTAGVKPGWSWKTIIQVPGPSVADAQAAAWEYAVVDGIVVQQWTVTDRPKSEMSGLVNAERDRRMSSLPFGGHAYDFDERSALNIAGAGTLALAARIAGAQVGDLRWADLDHDFKWVDANNASVTMDAHTCFAFAQAAAKWRSGHIRAARALKDADTIPADYASDAYWPTA